MCTFFLMYSPESTKRNGSPSKVESKRSPDYVTWPVLTERLPGSSAVSGSITIWPHFQKINE